MEVMDKRGKQTSNKRKFQMPEDDDKQNESILEEVLSISGKNVETSAEKDESPPVQLKRLANKQEKTIIEPKKVNAKESPVSPPTLSPPKKKKFTHEKKVNTVNENKMGNFKKGQPVPNLPDGWRRESVVRRSGKTAGQADIYFYSPDGRKLRSRPDVASYLFTHNMDIDLENFDFSKKSKAVAKKKAKGNSAASIKKEKTQEVKVNEVEFKNSKVMSAKKSKPPGKLSSKVPPLVDAENKKDPEVNEIDCKNSPKGMSAKRSKPSEKSPTKVSSLVDAEGKKDSEVNEDECKNSPKGMSAKRSKPTEKLSTKVPALSDAEDKKDPEVTEVECKNSSKGMSVKKLKPSEKSTKVPPLANAEYKKNHEKKSNTVLIKILESKPKKSRK